VEMVDTFGTFLQDVLVKLVSKKQLLGRRSQDSRGFSPPSSLEGEIEPADFMTSYRTDKFLPPQSKQQTLISTLGKKILNKVIPGWKRK
jgi:hypothetical protein